MHITLEVKKEKGSANKTPLDQVLLKGLILTSVIVFSYKHLKKTKQNKALTVTVQASMGNLNISPQEF